MSLRIYDDQIEFAKEWTDLMSKYYVAIRWAANFDDSGFIFYGGGESRLLPFTSVGVASGKGYFTETGK